ncbi:cyclic-di-GMP phosphodiesterase TipF (flagellum assembly factor) [Breoghania corrubedonensis]|uniref:Cyclic-di-GMP phosphodiesterase TipF (Flagellum assembly factor) n=2 Tax=Breoghania corrubedonensis TaxID=665038 RepID=A0A2T5VEX9_9HYPH|nr:cyclic-di-GMP phosphodiesterase TipF (flagellum assembly factor) [Breoghania corrubedonensis]
MVVIAGSASAVLYFLFGTSLGDATIVGTAILVAQYLVNLQVMRTRDKNRTQRQVDMVSRGVVQINQEVQSLENRLSAFENGFPARARDEIEPVFVEVEVLGTLVKQIAEAVADLETRVTEMPALMNARAGGGYVSPQPAGLSAPPRAIANGQAYAQSGNPGSGQAYGDAGGVSWQDPGAALWGAGGGTDDPALRDAVARAVEASRIDLYLQPVVTLPQRQVRYYEALTRLRTEDGEVLLPLHTVPIAESLGIIPTVDNVLLLRSVQVLRRLASRNKAVGLFCNISPLTLSDDKFFPGFIEYMDKNRQLAELIVLEFTQAGVDAMGPLEFETLSALHDVGFRFSVDQITDMGADFRGLSRRGFAYGKIAADRLLGRAPAVAGDIHPHDFADLLVRYGIELVADHIETEAQVLEVLEFGIGYGQGFLFSPPRPVRADVLQGGPLPGSERRRAVG